MPTGKPTTVRTESIALRLILGLSCAAALAAGCQSAGRREIPSGASLVRSGIGAVDYEARNDGDVYIYDASNGKLVYMGELKKSQAVHLDARADVITAAGKTVSERALTDNHQYQIFFRGN